LRIENYFEIIKTERLSQHINYSLKKLKRVGHTKQHDF